MTPTDLISHVNQSIQRARNGEGYIDASVLEIRGFATGTMQRLYSFLTRLPKPNPVYLEAGLYGGKSFCAAFNNHPDLVSFGVEDFSQPFGQDGIFDHLKENLARYRPSTNRVEIISGNCFEIDKNLIDQEVDIFLYDAQHDYESQRKALPHFLDKMSGLFLYIVDDYGWDDVMRGTRDAIQDISGKIKVERQWCLFGDKANDDSIYHNGLGIWAISKR